MITLYTMVSALFSFLSFFTVLLPFLSRRNFNENATLAVKTALYLSLIPLFMLITKGADNTCSITTAFPWLNNFCSNLALFTSFDKYQIIFLPIALFVTWSILQFSSWYMASDPKKDKFSSHLLLFLAMMIILISSGNLILFFIGWEGVGIMSFVLIGWYNSRANAAAAALMAVLYNRIGDIGLMMTLVSLTKSGGSTSFDFLFSSNPSTIFILNLILAAASKSAQFMFHPWLISAMEGPTPVSALLHSSTMVVAGVFLLIRIHPLFSHNYLILSVCLSLGAITSAFAAWSAVKQNDMKKIIALSTCSQLGLMMVAIGINLPDLAFFHMCSHAFFKAMLFLCSGVVIHNLNNNQDIRLMGGLFKALPISSTCITIGSLALMGTPYLIAFYSKDAIIESASNSIINTTALLLTLAATSCTAIYSLRMIYAVLLHQPRTTPTILVFDEPLATKGPLIRLAIGSVIGGPLLFWILFPSFPKEATLPDFMKWAALAITVASFLLAFLFAWWRHWSSPSPSALSKEFNPDLMSSSIHRFVVNRVLNSGWQVAAFGVDHALAEFSSKHTLNTLNIKMIKTITHTHKGLIQLYLACYFITLNQVFAYFI
uniref:NADH-ubiquinone oxidoreductase chain 5 n=1 Tax=Fejervarya cancrivora TaxID=111367 RepID=C3RXV0_FEJCA|nr:NADH dehydrogenase subunit 5 [Fejervarya cancrivora]ACD49895.1 NADH dehydrogenase subunit 5 [Fejervarya cancrivora]